MSERSVIGSRSYERFAGACALLAALAGLGYSTSFVVYLRDGSRAAQYGDALSLIAGGLLSLVVFVALYGRLRATDDGLALLGLVLAVTGAVGAALHGGYDLANLANPPAALASDVPSSTDPRGLGTFALAGLGLLVVGLLIVRGRALPVRLGYLALAGAALLVFVYAGRLVILDPKEPALLAAAVVSGFVVNPLWFGWLGVQLRRRPRLAALAAAA